MCISNPDGRSDHGFFKGASGKTKTSASSVTSGANLAVRFFSLLLLGYRWLISPWIGPRCRFLPTCSEYALDALGRHGAIRGGWLTVRRLLRCNPWGGSGFDPVPELDDDIRICRVTPSGQQSSGRQRPDPTF